MPKYADEQWQKMLETLSGRDAPIELSRRDANEQGPLLVYRSRLFDIDPGGAIIVERPAQAAIDKSFANGDDLELLLMHDGDRLVATCTIRETFIKQINPTTRVTCYRLSPGRRPVRDQRRRFFRVNVAAAGLDPVILESEGKGGMLQAKGQLVNLSGGGLGVSIRASGQLPSQIKRTRRFTCQAQLDSGEALVVPANVVYIAVREQDLLYLGLEIDVEDDSRARAIEDRLLQLCTEFQRQQLQRRRA